MANYPASLDVLANPTGGQVQGSTTPTHSGHHTNANDILEQLEAKLGIGASVAAANQVLRGTGAGATAFGQVVTADLAANAVTLGGFATIASQTTTSTTFGDVPGSSIAVTTTGGPSELWVWGVISVGGPLDTAVYLASQLDSGADSGDVPIVHARAGNQSCLSMFFRHSGVSAGAHTLKLRWRVSAGTASLLNGHHLVIEAKR